MKSKILVTAANGKVGHALVQDLTSRGLSVRAGVHDLEKARSMPALAEVVAIDFSDAESMKAALTGIDTLALITPPSPQQVDYATLTIDLAKAMGVHRVVRLSVLAAGMEPGIQLGRWHRTVERYLESSGLAWSILRPGPFFQNLKGMYGDNNGCFALPAGGAAVNHIDIADVAAFYAELVTDEKDDGRIHVVTGKEALRFEDIAQRLSDATGGTYGYRDVEPGAAFGDAPAWLSTILGELFAAFRTGAVGLKTSAFEERMGREPLSIEDFAKSIVARKAA